jgi:3-oxoacid CoA-transferase subunit A
MTTAISSHRKLRRSATAALAGKLDDGMSIAVGGFGTQGVPHDLIAAVRSSGVRDLTVVASSVAGAGVELVRLVEEGRVRRVIASYVGEGSLSAARARGSALDIEFCPQPTLDERLRAGGVGIAGFYTRTGVGSQVAQGKPCADFDGETYVLERAITVDLAIVRARLADQSGNLSYAPEARSFNSLVAMAGRTCVAEVEHVQYELLEPAGVHTRGIGVDRLVIPGKG